MSVESLVTEEEKPPPPPAPSVFFRPSGRFHFIVEEAHTGEIVSRDLVVLRSQVMRALSGPCQIRLEVDTRDPTAAGITFKPWSHWIHVEKVVGKERRIWASGLVQPSMIDKKTGIVSLVVQGFSAYPKKMPWLENWNPFACDVFEVVHKIWAHLQKYPGGNLGVKVEPLESGIIMLPGYAFDGNIANMNFYAMFIRAADKQDCQDNIDKLARDIPFDYREESAWDDVEFKINKKLVLGYPKLGYDQDNLAFVLGENVVEAKPFTETEIDWASDIIIDGWWPGSVYNSSISNMDPTRYRRVVQEDDARINSNERAHAWARRKLSRRQTPVHWESIIVDMDHPNAPFGSYDVGDRINVFGKMPTVGDVFQQHKIVAIAVDEQSSTCELTLKAEGAFNYDPIYYQGDVENSITLTHNRAPIISVLKAEKGTVGIA